MSIKYRAPEIGEALNFDQYNDKPRNMAFGGKRPFRQIENEDTRSSSSMILESDPFLSELTGHAISTREEIKKLNS